MQCACQYISKITSDLTKTTFYFKTFYSRKNNLKARSQGGNGGKMTQCNTISKPDIMPRGAVEGCANMPQRAVMPPLP